jgi:hypothetical protein
MSGSQAELDRHASILDFLASSSRKYNDTTKAIVPAQTQPM